jgi:hypothetical protein
LLEASGKLIARNHSIQRVASNCYVLLPIGSFSTTKLEDTLWLDLSCVYCEGETCVGAREGQPLFFDDNHPSTFANSLIAPLVARVLFEAASPSPAAHADPNDGKDASPPSP